jgi:hypothetical protein
MKARCARRHSVHRFIGSQADLSLAALALGSEPKNG